ncbi:hypothetical protein FC48_GL001192 [Ligilactobacillus murinus DSM 20452 = NBRC 14221]|uniref:Uncharacterized protein n=1 Tax=Ligilactobacillus murinus DSM 20452 = NBRC 14221 TaxID=1423772 RepID=A0A0R2B1Q9_9LACO|nr:hypothetical protein [Ligilactobacillus murinus]KRM73167.1 hypothetical protein FC48_GL001192 [Ligilactobacillus murinus DSM 20452 = NBRC 14221]
MKQILDDFTVLSKVYEVLKLGGHLGAQKTTPISEPSGHIHLVTIFQPVIDDT